MAWGEFHMLTGIALHEASQGRWWSALPLAIMSHWPLDDLNIGQIAKIYHGTGNRWITVPLRAPIVAAISYIFWNNPVAMICGLSAWLVLDHEWVLNLFGRHGYGLHKRMWPKWLHTKWGLIPWFIIFGLMINLLIGE